MKRINMKRIKETFSVVGLTLCLTLLALLMFLIVWSPMILLMFIISMIGLFIVPWLGYIFFSISLMLILLKFVIDLLNENGTQC